MKDKIKKSTLLSFEIKEIKPGCKNCWSYGDVAQFYIDDINNIEKKIDEYNRIIKETKLGCSVSFSIKISIKFSIIGALYDRSFYSISGYNKYKYPEMKKYYKENPPYDENYATLVQKIDKDKILKKLKYYISKKDIYLKDDK